MTKKIYGSSSLYIFILLLLNTYKDLISTYKNIANENIKVVNFYSQESKEFEEQKVSSKAKHIIQRIDQESLRKVLKVEKIGDCRFYCCGSERWFIGQEKESGVKTLLVNIGVKEDQIFTESFGPSFAIATAVSREPCFDSGSDEGNSVDKKSSKKAIQSIVAGVVGALKPGTKLEKVEDVEQSAHPPLKTI